MVCRRSMPIIVSALWSILIGMPKRPAFGEQKLGCEGDVGDNGTTPEQWAALV